LSGGGGARRELLRGAFVLPRDVLVFPVEELAERVREELGCAPGELAVTRPGFRSLSRIVDPETAALLEQFRSPRPIAEAVARLSRERGSDPETLLAAAFPVLQAFSEASILVPEGSPAAEGVEASFAPGRSVGGYEVRRLIQALEDTELYQAIAPDGAVVALKIARSARDPATALALEREAAILGRLGGGCAPALAAAGTLDGRPFLASRWLSGVPVTVRAEEIRSARGAGWRRRLHALGARVLRAHRALHEAGVVHGDVHPRNVLVDARDRVALLDFGLSRLPGERAGLDHERRAGLIWFLEPEAARPLLAGEPAPRASFAGDQYAAAALVYLLLSGAQAIEGPPEREALYRRAIETPPGPFAARGFESWPQVEAVLARALAKEPAHRFASVAELADAFDRAQPPRPAGRRASLRSTPAMRALVDGVLARVAEPRPPAERAALVPLAPRASLQYGAAGVAWFLYRAAQVRDSPQLAAAADLWVRDARALGAGEGGFEAPAVGIVGGRVGGGSLYHRLPGVHLVEALVASSRSDLVAAGAAAGRFAEACAPGIGATPDELAFGDAGGLVGGALLLEALRAARVDTGPLRAFLARRASEAAARLGALPPVGESSGEGRELPHLGIAHGWAGVLYAQILARRALGRVLPAALSQRLVQLAALAEPDGRGAAWNGTLRHGGPTAETPAHAPGWCSGSAGHVLLWTLAHEVTGERRHLELAERAGWHAWEHPDRHPRLCCGLAGRGFALLRLYRAIGDPAWLERARSLAARAAEGLGAAPLDDPRALSLYWGALGPALLAVELERPERAAFPAFEPEGWPAG
jgi:serine/threonine-protein kinase